MKYTRIVSLAVCMSVPVCKAETPTAVTPYLNFRSQSQNLAREMVGTSDTLHKSGMDSFYGSFAVAAEYTQSFNGDDSAHSLFGCYYLQDCSTIKITGSDVEDRSNKELLANWFYLPSDYEGSICFEPVIRNSLIDMNLYWGMDAWTEGTFFRIHAPLAWTQWNLGAKFTTKEKGTNPQDEQIVLVDAEKFFCAQGRASEEGIIFRPLSCARFCGCSCDASKTKIRIADIQADLGWNFLLDNNYHLGLFARMVAPTGNSPKGEWLFEPIIGNGGHWELGGGLTGEALLWDNQEENKNLKVSVNIDVTHLFTTEQNRVFDLKNKPLSRYMTAEKFTDATQTANEFAPIANLTSCKRNVSIKVQADIAALFTYTSDNWTYDLGYNFWARSCEHFECDTCACCEECSSCCGRCIIKKNEEKWGITQVSGEGTASDATISNAGTADTTPIFIKDSDVDYDSARTKGMSQKIVAHVNYTWDETKFSPFVGVGGFAEFGINESCCSAICDCNATSCSSNNTSNNCPCCKNVSLSQWGLLLKGGLSF